MNNFPLSILVYGINLWRMLYFYLQSITSSKLLEPADQILEKRNKKKVKGSMDYLQSSWQHKTNAFANWQLCCKALEGISLVMLCL